MQAETPTGMETAIVVRERRAGGDVLWLYQPDGTLAPLDEAPGAYVDFAARLRATALGRYGRRAGDVILFSHYATEDDHRQRYYFSKRKRSLPSRARAVRRSRCSGRCSPSWSRTVGTW